jgi:hypothetical protein
VSKPVQTTCKICGAPRWAKAKTAHCETHARDYQRAFNDRAVAEGRGVRSAECQRIDETVRAAVALGATEDEAWRIAIAAEIETDGRGFAPHQRRPFIERELAFLRQVDAARQAKPTKGRAA